MPDALLQRPTKVTNNNRFSRARDPWRFFEQHFGDTQALEEPTERVAKLAGPQKVAGRCAMDNDVGSFRFRNSLQSYPIQRSGSVALISGMVIFAGHTANRVTAANFRPARNRAMSMASLRPRCCTLAVGLLLGLTPSLLPATTFYIASNGNDAWSGKLAEPNAAGTDGPLASLTAARDAVRRLKSQGPLRAPVNVCLRGGTYYLQSGLVLDAQDSGVEACPVTYRAQADEKPILCGGLRLTEWKPYRGNIFSCALSPDRLAGTAPKQLFYRGERQVLARYPNRDPKHPRTGGCLYMERPVQENGNWFFWCPTDVFPRKWANPKEVEINFFDASGYFNNILPLGQILDAKHRIIAPAFPGGAFSNSGHRFFIRNALEELDAPGEWYYDQRSATVYFWPPDDQLRQQGAIVPRIADLLVCRGNFDKKEFVHHVAFERLGLECCHADGIVLEAARQCQVTACMLTNIGRTAILLGEGSSKCRVAANDIAYPGGQAIATAPGVNVPKATADHVITNNYAHHCGEIWTCGVGWGSGIYIAGRHHLVSHNLLHDTPYSVINFTGWDHLIEYNHCHHGVLECFDGAGIYGWVDPKGGSGGNVVRFNRIHDIVGYGIPWISSPKIPADFQSPFFSWGIYLDDELCDTTIQGNLVYRVAGGILLHGCWNTRVENNIFAQASDEQIRIGNMQPDKYPAIQKTPAAGLPGSMSNNLVERNIISSASTRPDLYFASGWLNQAVTFRQNLIDNHVLPLKIRLEPHGAPIAFPWEQWRTATDSWDQWRTRGQDAESLVCDPRFVDAAHDDYRLRTDSPAAALGFQSLPIEKMGLFRNQDRRQLPPAVP
jgi:parallel beta-helix repeat protein